MIRVKCSLCGRQFDRKKSQVERAKNNYCSENCQHKARKDGTVFPCFICRKEIYRSKSAIEKNISKKFFCSSKCCMLWQNSEFVGEKHPNWKGGKCSYRGILTKKDPIPFCRVCSKDDKRVLVVHHIDQDRKNNSPENLVWLCHNCHHLIHKHQDACVHKLVKSL